MKKISLDKRNLLSMAISLIVGSMFILLGMFAVGNQPEKYNDIIVETLAKNNMNITGELRVFWIILFLGIPILLLLDSFITRKEKKNTFSDVSFFAGSQIVMNVGNMIYYLIYGKLSLLLLGVAFITFINHVFFEVEDKENLVLTTITYYFLFAIQTFLNYIGIKCSIQPIFFMGIVAIFVWIFLYFNHKKAILKKSIMIMQCFLPLILLIFQVNRYTYNGQVMYLKEPFFAKCFFAILILSFTIYAIYQLKKNWSSLEEKSIASLILLSTCIILFAINSLELNTSFGIPDELHHSGEEILSFQQIFSKGQIPYQDYSPVSGLFSVLLGFVLELLGGKMVYYSLARVIFMFIFIIFTMYFLSKHLSKDKCLFSILLFAFPEYDRIVFILLTLLILFLPNLLKKPNTWLKIWIWLCFIGGLYYPTFGVATLIGTLPMGISEFISYIKSEEFKIQKKKKSFYIGWILTLIPIIICLPLLIRLAKHILLYSKQTNLADGIAVFGQGFPEWFMPYVPIKTLKLLLYYVIRYLLPIGFVWLFALLVKKMKKEYTFRELFKKREFQLLIAVIFILLISYKSVMVRNDSMTLLSRPKFVLILLGGFVFYWFFDKYMKKNYVSYVLLGILFGLFLSMDLAGITSLENKQLYSYSFSNEYVFLDEEQGKMYPRLGSGFINQKVLDELNHYSQAYQLLEYDPDLKFLGWGLLGDYYILDLTTVGQPSIYAAKDYDTHKEIIEAIKKQRPVIGLRFSSSFVNHYLYNYLLLDESYVYDEEYTAFLPKELFYKVHGEDAIPTDKRNIPLYLTNLDRIPTSLGESIKSLEKILEETDISTQIEKNVKEENVNYNITLNKEIFGADANYLYIKFDTTALLEKVKQNQTLSQNLLKQYGFDNIIVEVAFGDEEKDTMTCFLGRGELLIPLTVNVNWYLNYHDNFTLTLKNLEEPLDIQELKLYKLDRSF